MSHGPRAWAALPGATRGALLLFAAGTTFTLSSALVKEVGGRLDTAQIVFLRAAFGLALLTPFLIRRDPLQPFRTAHPWRHLSRGLLGVVAMSLGFYAVAHQPLADAVALSFTKPLWVTALSALVLGEAVRWRRWSATIAGFCGVLVMLWPALRGGGLAGGETLAAPAAALAAAFLVGWIAIVMRTLAQTERPLTVLLWFGLLTSALTAPLAILSWREPSWHDLALCGGIAASSTWSQGLMVRAYAAAEASQIAPVDYTRLLVAAAIGWAWFAEAPTAWTLGGAGIVIASALYIAWREAQLGRRAKAPPAA